MYNEEKIIYDSVFLTVDLCYFIPIENLLDDIIQDYIKIREKVIIVKPEVCCFGNRYSHL